MENKRLETDFITLYMENEIAFMILHNGIQNKIQCPEFIPLTLFEAFMTRNKPKALVIKGIKRNFSAGADIEKIVTMNKSMDDFMVMINKGKDLLSYIENLTCITVAQISGICFGGGLEIALSCQFRIAANTAVFAFPESTLGLLPGMGGTVRLQELIGKRDAIKMIVSGETYFAHDAFKMGLVDLLTDKQNLTSETMAFIENMCKDRVSEHIMDIVGVINDRSYQNETELFAKYAVKQGMITG